MFYIISKYYVIKINEYNNDSKKKLKVFFENYME